MLKLSLRAVSVATPNAATQYFFGEYFDTVAAPILVDPAERNSRSRPTVGLDVLQVRSAQLHDRVDLHENFLRQLAASPDYFWFSHPYWQRDPENIKRLVNVARLFNRINGALNFDPQDPIKPSHNRCDVCLQNVSIKDKRHGCQGTRTSITSLSEGFLPDVIMDCSVLKTMVDAPQDITSTTISSMLEVLRFFKTSGEASRWGAPDTIDGHLKHLLFERPSSILPGVLQLLVAGSSLVCSEAIAETYGSVMEDYQKGRFINTGTANDDIRLQKEMFVRVNGPPLAHSASLCRRIAAKLKVAPTSAYQNLHPTQRHYKKSKVLKRLNENKPRFFNI